VSGENPKIVAPDKVYAGSHIDLADGEKLNAK